MSSVDAMYGQWLAQLEACHLLLSSLTWRADSNLNCISESEWPVDGHQTANIILT